MHAKFLGGGRSLVIVAPPPSGYALATIGGSIVSMHDLESGCKKKLTIATIRFVFASFRKINSGKSENCKIPC